MVAMPSSRFMVLIEDRNPARTVGRGVGEERPGEVQCARARIGTEDTAHETVAGGGAQCQGHRGRGDESGGEALGRPGPVPMSAAAVATSTMARAAGRQDLGVVGGECHDGHAAHGVPGQDGVGDVAGGRAPPPGRRPASRCSTAPCPGCWRRGPAGRRAPRGDRIRPVGGRPGSRWRGCSSSSGGGPPLVPAHIPHGQSAPSAGVHGELSGRLEHPPSQLSSSSPGRSSGGSVVQGPVRVREAAPSVGGRPADQGGGGTEREEAATAAGDVERWHYRRPLRRANRLLEGDRREPVGVPAEDRFESHRDQGPIGGDGLDDGAPTISGGWARAKPLTSRARAGGSSLPPVKRAECTIGVLMKPGQMAVTPTPDRSPVGPQALGELEDGRLGRP